MEGDPFLNGKSKSMSGGLDGKIGITNDITLDFSVNPDFGQVEADPSEVNLTAFETYFSERRPFFIEGKNIYQYSPNQTIVINNMQSDNLFYSRRIGRYPHNYPSLQVNEYADVPDATTILAAAKVSGKTRKGLEIGILESVTSKEEAIIDNEGSRREEIVEPLTNYFVARLKQDLNKGETVIGGIFTAVNRDITNPALNYLPVSAYTGGIDFKQSWKERTWYLEGNAEFSNINGTEEAMIYLQRSSARYYQRPDASYVSVDSSITSLSGYGGTLKFGRSSQKRIQFETSLTVRSPGLEFNDIGFMRYSDVIHHGSWAAYYIRNPFAIFNNFYLNTNYWMYWDYSGKLLSALTNMNFNSQFKNRWRINGSFTLQSQTTSNNLLRGGPSMLYPGGFEMNMNLSTDQSKKLVFSAGFYNYLGNTKSSRYGSYWIGGAIKPMNILTTSFELDYSTQTKKLQYIRNLTWDNSERYIFGELNQKTLAFTFRINLTISPELTIEYYGQPFISAGNYSHFKRITDTHAEEFEDRYHVFTGNEISYDVYSTLYNVDENNDAVTDYYLGNPDFSFQQFRSNLVVRWEYLPGSIVYLVWSQGRTNSTSEGIFSFGDNMKDLFGVVPHNVFLVKLSYWFSL